MAKNVGKKTKKKTPSKKTKKKETTPSEYVSSLLELHKWQGALLNKLNKEIS